MAANLVQIDLKNNMSEEEEEELLSIFRGILKGKFSSSSFKERLFNFLHDKEGKTIIEALLQLPKTNVSQRISKQIFELLVNAAGNFYDDNKKTVLHFASSYGWLGIVQSLLKEGADPNVQDIKGYTPLLVATNSQHRDVVDLLVESGADLFCCTLENYTLLHTATFEGWVDFVQFLLTKGADPNAEDSYGCTPLYVAILQKQRDIVTLLIDNGADTACCTFQGMPVLHCAVIVNNLEVVKCLVEKGADVDDQRIMGVSPLGVACRRIGEIDQQKIEIIEYLVNAVNIKNESNLTPLQYIIRYHRDLVLYKTFVERYGYLGNFVDDYYNGDELNLYAKSDIFQNVQACTQAIITKFNNKDLPAFYNLPLPHGALPPLKNLMITSQGMIQDIEQSVRYEINTSQHCDLRKPKVIVLRMLAVKCYTKNYNSLTQESQLRRSASADSGELSQSLSKIQLLD